MPHSRVGNENGYPSASSTEGRRNEELRRRIDRAIEEGWQVESETPGRVVLVRRSYGSPVLHLVIAALTLWWAFGAANALYAAYAYVTDVERRVLRAPERSCSECGAALDPNASYCRICGADAEEASVPPVCSDCGAPTPADANFCSDCGASLGDKPGH